MYCLLKGAKVSSTITTFFRMNVEPTYGKKGASLVRSSERIVEKSLEAWNARQLSDNWKK